jgi:hypothetical protein
MLEACIIGCQIGGCLSPSPIDQGFLRQFGLDHNIFSQSLPLRLFFESNWTLSQAIELTHRNVLEQKKHLTFIKDVFFRVPHLKNHVSNTLDRWPVCVEICSLDALHQEEGTFNSCDLKLQITDDGESFKWVYDLHLFSRHSIMKMTNQYLKLLQEVSLSPHLNIQDISLPGDDKGESRQKKHALPLEHFL